MVQAKQIRFSVASGEYKQELIELKDEKSDDQKLFMINHWGFKDPDQIRFDTSDKRNDLQLNLDQQLELIPELKTGSKMFLRPSIHDLWAVKLPKAENRKQDFYFACPFYEDRYYSYQTANRICGRCVASVHFRQLQIRQLCIQVLV